MSMDINEIARRAGVSRATVSRYLNDGYVSKEKRKLIGKIIDETGYVPSRNAQQLRSGKTRLVGTIIPKINSQSVSRMVSGITHVLSDNGYQTLLANAGNDEKKEVEYLELLNEKNRVDGIILIATVLTPEHHAAIQRLRVPVVVLNQHIDGYSCIFQDDYNAMRDVGRLVLPRSKRPTYLGVFERDVAAGRERHRGFLDACEEMGLSVDDRAQKTVSFDVDSGYFGAEQLLQDVPDLDTIMCATDSIAFGAMMCMREYGKRVPEDVQITGVGDSMLSRIIHPSLTTVHFHYETSGIKAAEALLVHMMSSESATKVIEMPYTVYGRNSMR